MPRVIKPNELGRVRLKLAEPAAQEKPVKPPAAQAKGADPKPAAPDATQEVLAALKSIAEIQAQTVQQLNASPRQAPAAPKTKSSRQEGAFTFEVDRNRRGLISTITAHGDSGESWLFDVQRDDAGLIQTIVAIPQ